MRNERAKVEVRIYVCSGAETLIAGHRKSDLIPMSDVPSPEQLYRKFEGAVLNQNDGAWTLAVFEGSPQNGAYSWCSDCIAVKEDLRNFIAGYKGGVKVAQFKVGLKEEWEGEGPGHNPFKARPPHLSDLPTAVLFYGGLDVARVSIPRLADLQFLSERAEAYAEQIKNKSWSPPKRTRLPA
jgi:Eukaryotic protein of unknown function (DUF953)